MFRNLVITLEPSDIKTLEGMTEVQLAQMINLMQDESFLNQDLHRKILEFKPVLNTIFYQLKRGIKCKSYF